jgi:hypothetical protein
MGLLGRGSGGGGRFKRRLFFVPTHPHHTQFSRSTPSETACLSVMHFSIARYSLVVRRAVSTFLYYNIYGTVSTFSRSPCGWEVLLSVVPFAVLPGHSLGCLQYLCIQEESRPSILFIFASTYASTVSPRTPDTLLNAMARMVTTTTHLPVSLQER